MPIVQTQDITPGYRATASENLQIYCALDSMVTLEVLNELNRTFNQEPQVYSFSRALQAPYLEIMQRGFRVDELSRQQAGALLRERIQEVNQVLQELAQAAWGKPLNPRSPTQLRDFFYRTMRLPEVWLSQKGEKKLSTNREALEKLDIYMYARPIIACILRIRDLAKQLELFESEIDQDGRFRASYNIAGTETGRPSSSKNAFGTGRNAQNIDPKLRFVFIADLGYKLCVIDLEQVEARDCGYFFGCLFDDWTFLDACESGDLHTNNSKLIWPEIKWTGEPKPDRALADQVFYRDFTYRDMSKRGGHLSNYYGTAWTMSRSLKIPIKVAEDFQARYNHGSACAYPAFQRWWQWTAQELQTTHRLTNPFGRTRHFFGRPGDDTTLREAIANLPQSTTADRMNLGLWRTWKREPSVQLLAQTYDSITFQVKEGPAFDDTISRVLEHIKVELNCRGRSYVVPGEAKVGWNWGAAHVHDGKCEAEAKKKGLRACPQRANPDGLLKWSPKARDLRTRQIGLKRIME